MEIGGLVLNHQCEPFKVFHLIESACLNVEAGGCEFPFFTETKVGSVLDDGADGFAFFPTEGEGHAAGVAGDVRCCHGNQSFVVGSLLDVFSLTPTLIMCNFRERTSRGFRMNNEDCRADTAEGLFKGIKKFGGLVEGSCNKWGTQSRRGRKYLVGVGGFLVLLLFVVKAGEVDSGGNCCPDGSYQHKCHQSQFGYPSCKDSDGEDSHDECNDQEDNEAKA